MNQKLNLKFEGELHIVERIRETGEVCGEFHEHNVITDEGLEVILDAISSGAGSENAVETISIGTDIGDGTILNPESPTTATTAADHDGIFVVPDGDFFIDRNVSNEVRFFASVDGEQVMSLFPSEANIIYTSAMLRSGNNRAVAYRRFPARTISRAISVDINWIVRVSQVV